MTRTRLGTIIPVAILLLSTISCGPFMTPAKPTQVVDIAPMIGKSLPEMEARLGPSRPQGECRAWDLPEGELILCYRDGSHAKSIQYHFPPAPLFSPRTAVSSIEETAALGRIDTQGRKPDTEFQGGYSYKALVLDGKAVEVAFDGGPKTIVGVRVDVATSATNNSPTGAGTPAQAAGVTMANFNRLQNGMTYAQVVQILGKEGEESGVLGSGADKIVMYKWDADNGDSGARLDAFFKNGKLDSKLQIALK